MVDARLQDGSRVNAIIPPLSSMDQYCQSDVWFRPAEDDALVATMALYQRDRG